MPDEDELVSAIKHCPPGETGALLGQYYELVDAQLGGTSALLFACYLGRADVAEAIARKRRSIDVFEAAALGDVTALAAALNENPSRANEAAGDGFRPLGLAAYFGREEAARLLVERGADPAAPSLNPSRVAPLHSAVAAQAHGIATLLLDRGAPVDARQVNGFTPLMAAAHRGDQAMVELLLSHGADPNLRDDQGKSAADHAREAGRA